MKKIFENNYPSVTGVLGVLRKIGLENWFKVNTPEFIKTESDKGKEIGKILHEAIESHIDKEKISFETEYPEEVKIALQSFFLFKKENPEIMLKKAEMKLTSEKYKFNGVMDCLAVYKGQNIIMDWKTGTAKEKEKPGIYDEMKYQISAYVYLYNEVMKKDVDTAMIIVFAKDKIAYNQLILTKNYIDRKFEKVFLNCLEIWNEQQKEKEGN